MSMIFAEKHSCHRGERFITSVSAFREPDGRHPFRACDYCGSMHPEDLIAALGRGAHLEHADMKYGWPHKFYVVGGGIDHAKFYNQHIFDEHDAEAREALIAAVWKHSGIRFEVLPDGRFRWDGRTPFPSDPPTNAVDSQADPSTP